MKKRSDGRYVLKQTFDINGKKTTKMFYGRTQAEARQKLTDYIRSQDSSKATFRDMYNQYKVIEEARIKPVEYQTKCNRIEAFTGILDCRLDVITPKMIALDLNKIAVKNPRTRKPTAKRTLTRYLQAVSNVFEFAEENRLATYNPARYVKIPADAPQTKREALSPEEYKQLLKTTDPFLFPVRFLILMGLRKGEASMLQYRDVDLDNKVINVYKSYDFKAKVIKMPKSKAGIRSVPIPPQLIPELTEMKKTHSLTDYVFNDDGNIMSHYNWNRYVQKCGKMTGVEFTLHQLRHTTATIYYYSGIQVKEAALYLGHSDERITLQIYTSIENTDKVKNASLDKLERFLANI